MRIDPELVSRIARLAALRLEDGEAAEMAGQLTRIVEHFEALRSVPDELLAGIADAPETPLRPDDGAAVGTMPAPVVEANAPAFSHGHFVVPRVVNRDGGA